jgi:hypothetical protein
MRVFTVAMGLLCGLVACDSGTEQPAANTCELSFDNLAGTDWLMFEPQPEGPNKENAMARIRFEDRDGTLWSQYTVKSLGDVYDYECTLRGEGDKQELYCAEEVRLVDWCQALLVHDEDACTPEALRELGAQDATDKEIKDAIKEATKMVDKFRDGDKWDHFVLNNNNLGNKLQGRLYIKIDHRRCRLSVGDYYFVIFNGKGKEDTNPVGQNPFVQTQDPYLFEHCDNGSDLVDWEEAELPKDLSKVPVRRPPREAGKKIFYHFLGDKKGDSLYKAKDSCTYAFDSYALWRPVDKNVPVSANDKGLLKWGSSHTFKEDELININGMTGGVFHMVRKKTCDGKTETVDVVCNACRVTR